jgi:hypothetical protein
VINTPGLRLSLVGGIVVAVSLIAIVFLPDTVPAVAMMFGGLAVIGGFVWSLADFYFVKPPPDEPPNGSS